MSKPRLRVPRYITFFGTRWPVCIDTGLQARGLHGITEFAPRRIGIGAHLRGRFRDEVLIHEFLHAMLHSRRLRGCVRQRYEEKLVNAIAARLAQVLGRLG